MAAPIAHIFCALMVLQSGTLKIKNEKEFIVGTSFPDIRYLTKLPRTNTHKHPTTWLDVKNASSDFQAGVLLHSLLDECRIKHIEIEGNRHIPSILVMKEYMLKFFEDTLLYDKVADWPKIISYFDEILPEELTYVTNEQAREWHNFIQKYCAKKTSPSHLQYMVDITPHLSASMKKTPSLLNQMYMAFVFYRYRNKKNLMRLLDDFYSNITQNIMAYQPYAKSVQAKLAALHPDPVSSVAT